LARDGVPRLGRKLAQGFEYEAPLVHAWMWNFEYGATNGRSAVQEDIDIDDTRTLGEVPYTAHLALDALHALKQAQGQEFRFELGYAIQEVGLVGVVHGRSFVHRGHTSKPQVGRLVESLQRRLQRGLPVTDVRP
jgi:hypothetical protein